MVMKRHRVKLWVLLLVLLCFQLPVNGMQGNGLALISVNNFSGVDSVGSQKIDKLVSDEFSELIKANGSIQYLGLSKTEEKLKEAGLESYYEAANLCTEQEYTAIAKKLGTDHIGILDIYGYNEVKQEKSKKTYQLLLGLRVIDAADGSVTNYSGEGFSDKSRDEALANAVNQLISGYRDQNSGEQSTSVRSYDAPVIGHKASGYYHLTDTHHAPSQANQISFEKRSEAEANGYKPCPICFPSYKSFSYSDRDLEEQLGQEGCGSIEYYYRVDHNPALIERLERVAEPLIQRSHRKNIDYKFRILDTPEVNAFAAPNGYIYVTKGMFDVVESDDELAFVISHELGHLEKKHAVIRYRRAVATALIASIFIASASNNNDQGAALMATIMAGIVLRGYSREQEHEADQVAVARLKQANLDYQVYHTLMGRFMDMRKNRIYAINKLFATHPTPEARIEKLTNYLKAYETLQTKLAL
jgi:hypothetical protein